MTRKMMTKKTKTKTKQPKKPPTIFEKRDKRQEEFEYLQSLT